MIGFLKQLFDDDAEQKRLQTEETELRKTLAEKLARYQSGTNDDSDYTEVVIDGRKLRIGTERITLKDDATPE